LKLVQGNEQLEGKHRNGREDTIKAENGKAILVVDIQAFLYSPFFQTEKWVFIRNYHKVFGKDVGKFQWLGRKRKTLSPTKTCSYIILNDNKVKRMGKYKNNDITSKQKYNPYI